MRYWSNNIQLKPTGISTIFADQRREFGLPQVFLGTQVTVSCTCIILVPGWVIFISLILTIILFNWYYCFTLFEDGDIRYTEVKKFAQGYTASGQVET